MFKMRREQKDAFIAEFGRMTAPCAYCLVVRFVEIRGLYIPGAHPLFPPPRGLIQGSRYLPGYASEDDRGRIYISRDAGGKWKKSTQGIEITVRVDPPSIPIPPGTKITWSFEDPDDPTNENPRMHRDAGRLLDPNDYVGRQKVGEKANDNDPSKKALARPRFTELEPRFPLSAHQTPVDPLTRESKVRFDVSDIAGDNFRIRAEIKPVVAPIVTAVPAITGVMTVWNRIDVEYVKMASARELPVEQIAAHFDLACAQIDISLKTEARGDDDKPFMGETEADADTMLEFYGSRAAGVFTKEGEPGWFLLVAANRYVKEVHETVLYEGEAFANGQFIRFPPGKLYFGTPEVVRVYNPARVRGLVPPYPRSRDLQTSFEAGLPQSFRGFLWLALQPNTYYDVNHYERPFLNANLTDYGFSADQSIQVQIASKGEENSFPVGLSMTRNVAGQELFSGRVFIFTSTLPPEHTIVTLCHEIGHAFENTHMCGNWDWVDDADRHSCCLSYSRMFVLDDAKKRKPIPWTQGRRSAEFCAPHLRRLRDFHLEDNRGYAWRQT